MSGDRIELRGLRGRGRHGVLATERENGQDFFVDVVLDVDLSDAGRSDDLRDTVHYGDLAERVVAIVEGDPVALIEALATRIADHCLGLARVERVEVTVHKPQAPIDVPFADVAVTVVRTP